MNVNFSRESIHIEISVISYNSPPECATFELYALKKLRHIGRRGMTEFKDLTSLTKDKVSDIIRSLSPHLSKSYWLRRSWDRVFQSIKKYDLE